MELLIDKVNSDRKEILKNLMTLYLHDLSEFIDNISLNSNNGLFEFDVLDWFFSVACSAKGSLASKNFRRVK